MSSSPGTSIRTAAATRSPRSASASSSAWAWTRGPREAVEDHAVAPRRAGRAGRAAAGRRSRRARAGPRPCSRRASIPRGVPSRTAARNRSPVATMGIPRRSASERCLGALPGAGGAEEDDRIHGTATAPGGDHRMKPSYWRIRSCASSCFIVSTTTDTTISRPVPPRAMPWNSRLDEADERRQRRHDAQEQRAGHRDPGHDPGQVVLRRAARADARDEAAVLAQLLGGLVRLERERRVEVREPERSAGSTAATYSHEPGLSHVTIALRDVARRGSASSTK